MGNIEEIKSIRLKRPKPEDALPVSICKTAGQNRVDDQDLIKPARLKKKHALEERVKEFTCLYKLSKLKDTSGSDIESFFQKAVKLMPPSWQYPEITCSRITFEGKEYLTSGFRESSWIQSAPIIVDGEEAGRLDVVYLEKTPDEQEGPFIREERALIDTLVREMGRHVERKRAETELERANYHLRVERETVNEKNTALKEVLHQIDDEKRQVALQIQSNIDRIALPLFKIIEEKMDEESRHYISLIENCLSDITSPFINQLEKDYSRLTPREIEICNMTRSGFSSKAISTALNTSIHTVHNQRKQIRKKLGVSGKKVNLAAFLQKT